MQQSRTKPIMLLLILGLIIAGSIFLILKDIPANQTSIEQPLPTERFLKP